jgi:hypothetical protein
VSTFRHIDAHLSQVREIGGGFRSTASPLRKLASYRPIGEDAVAVGQQRRSHVQEDHGGLEAAYPYRANVHLSFGAFGPCWVVAASDR